ncbi:MAG: Cys-tRNA(Pro) deacylase [Deltaproteobacteria bacterium]|nr:Cys-tRNA(Pro) deacylase [Deltaproteobacteria bacterium]
MARDDKAPTTLATRALDAAGVAYTTHLFRYEDKGGTRHSSSELGVDEHAVIKTLVFEDEARAPLVVLMHGDMTVSTKDLARALGKKTIAPAAPATAEKHTGYQVGGTSPFGLRKVMPVYVERSVLALERIYINGGKRGFLVALAPSELARVLAPTPVEVANPR